jgi:hypothetical protein
MNRVSPPHESKRNTSSAWILRLTLGSVLIGVSVWGIALCHEIFRGSIGSGSVPGDTGFVNVAAWAAWALFFGPLAGVGVAMVWSMLRKMDALDQVAFWLAGRAGRPDALVGSAGQYTGIAEGSNTSDPHGLEDLSAETVERLQRTATRAATILGGLAGVFMFGIGIFGLIFLLFFPQTNIGSSIYVPLATSRFTITFALFFGMLVLLGLVFLEHTFRRENGSWLLPLKVFTYIVRRRARLGEHHLPSTKQHPRV